MRRLVLLLAFLPLTACSQDVALRNPVTGEVASCHGGPLGELNPWSQFDMCVENYVAEGWTRE
jgi:hypothetical protein